MKKSLFAIALLLLLSPSAVRAESDSNGTTASSDAAVAGLIQNAEDKAFSADAEKQRKRELAKLKKKQELELRKARWKNLTPDKKKSAEMKRKIAALDMDGGFDESDLPKETREQIQKLTPEDKEESKREAIKQWTKYSADQKYFIKKNAKEKWNDLTQEEKEQFKAILEYDKDTGIVTTDKVVSRPREFRPSIANGYQGQSGGTAFVRRPVGSVSHDAGDVAVNSAGGGYSYSIFGPGGIRKK